jgi:Domain of unknown function (DUF4956)
MRHRTPCAVRTSTRRMSVWRLSAGWSFAMALTVVVPPSPVMAQPPDSSQAASPLPALSQGDQRDLSRHQAREAVEQLTNGAGRFGTITPIWRRQYAIATLLALTGALLLALPPVLVYRVTTPADRFDSALAQSIFILPVAVAGIVTVIQGSLAVAFGLAGVVTTVRFRSALRDTDDAAYIFLAVAIGVAAGAAALDIATVLSGFFCAAMLLLWGARLYAERTGHAAWVTKQKKKHKGGEGAKEVNHEVASTEEGDRHSVLVIHAPRSDIGQRLVEPLLGSLTKSWALQHVTTETDGSASLTYSVHLRKHMSAAGLVSAIQVAAGGSGIGATAATPVQSPAAVGAPSTVTPSADGANVAPTLSASASSKGRGS